MKKPKILLYDIETTPLVSYTWGTYDVNVIGVQKDWELLSFAWKFLGEKKVRSLTRADLSDKTEKSLVTLLWQTLNSADIIITHNGIKFDNKKSNAKFIQYGLKPLQPAQQVDTLRVARSNFAFTSNKLDDLGKILKVGRKLSTGGFDLWLKCMAGEKAAFAKMAKYNRGDVQLLEKVYLKLLPWINNHPNVIQLQGRPKGCPKCGHQKLKVHGFRYTKTAAYRRYVCLSCGGYCKGESVKDAVKPKVVGL